MHPTTPQRFRLFYVDDSGAPVSGIVVYSFSEPEELGPMTHERIREIVRAIPLELRAEMVHVLATANHPK